jgi:hypothetical protein
MVVGWHLFLQELDFTLEYVEGVEITIADAMSRFRINNSPPKLETAIQGTYILSDETFRLIEQCHNTFNGHGRVKRTIHKLHLLKLKWPNMRLDVKTFIRECPYCQKMSQIQVPIQAYKYVTSTCRPMECQNIDFIGPYPDILVIIDCFTRWVELYAVPEATAHEACLCLIQHFGRYCEESYNTLTEIVQR